MDTANASQPSVVRTAAVLHLDSPCTSDVRVDSGDAPAEHDIKLSYSFNTFGLPTIDGELVRKYLEGASDSEGKLGDVASSAGPNDTGDCEESTSRSSQRLEAVLNTLAQMYKNPPDTQAASATSVKTGDGWCSLLPDGPYAVAIITGKVPQTTGPQFTGSPCPELIAPPPAPAFPPIWLSALSRSLIFLDLSSSPHLDPANWNLSALKNLSRLALISLCEAVIVSPLPEALITSLPALCVLDLCDAKFQIPQEEVASMLVALSKSGETNAGSRGSSRHVVVTTGEEVQDWKSLDGLRQRRMEMRGPSRPALRLKCKPPEDKAAFEGDSRSKTRSSVNYAHTDGIIFTDAAAIRAVRAARERAFLALAQRAWWDVSLEGTSQLVAQPLDISMIRLLYDLALLPPLVEPQQPCLAGTQKVGSGDGQGQGGASGEDTDKDKDFGAEFVISGKPPRFAEPSIDCTSLQIAWQYDCPRWDAPTWSHAQSLHSKHRGSLEVFLSSRQLKLLMEDATHGSADRLASAGPPGLDADDPFAMEVLAFQALEDRERLMSATLFAASTGRAEGMLPISKRLHKGSRPVEGVDERKPISSSMARPHPGSKVIVPTASALAARSRARQLLVAGLLGEGLAAVSPAQRGAVTLGCLLLAMRLEARLYGRVRRVSILPRNHPSYSAIHAGRYWSSVQSLHDLLRSDPMVRRGVVAGTVPLAAAVELPAAELRTLMHKMDKASRKGLLTAGAGGSTAVLAEKALLAADVADLDALQKQASVGGHLDVQIPLFTEDWQPSERKADSLCAWHIADPWIWPHGTVLHNAVALGHLRTASWLLEQGLPINGRISRWDLAPLHLCCLRPCIWEADWPFLHLFRVPTRRRHDKSSYGSAYNAVDIEAHVDKSDEEPESQYNTGMEIMAAPMIARWDRKTKEDYLKPDVLLFPGVCDVKNGQFLPNALLGPMWFSVDDEATFKNPVSVVRIQSPFVRTLHCTAPAATLASDGEAGSSATTRLASPSALAAAASPMLHLLLRHSPDLAARSWCGLLPLHYAAATCGAEAVLALVDAGASLNTPLPGTLVGPLHLLAYRSTCRWSGMSPKAAVRLLSCQPIIPAEEVLVHMDEWRGCPLSWLMQGDTLVPAAGLLPPLLQSLRKKLASPAAGGAGAERQGHAFKDALFGVARALCSAIVKERLDHVRVLLQHFPEAVTVTMPPAEVTPLHIACCMVAWSDVPMGHVLRMSVLGDLYERGPRPPKALIPFITPFLPSGVAITTTTTTSVPPKTSSSGSRSSGAGRELLVLGDEPPTALSSRSGLGLGWAAAVEPATAPCPDGESLERWEYSLYPTVNNGPPVNEDAGESDSSAMQRCLNIQLQIVQLLLGAGAPVDARDAWGFTPLIVACLTSSPPVVSLLLEKGASLNVLAEHAVAEAELFTSKRLMDTWRLRDSRVLGLDFLLFSDCKEPQQEELRKRVKELRKKDKKEREEAEKKKRERAGVGWGSSRHSSRGPRQLSKKKDGEDDGDDDDDDKDAATEGPEEEGDDDDEEADSSSTEGSYDDEYQLWKLPRYTALGDRFLVVPFRDKETYKNIALQTVVTPLTAAVIRQMQVYTCYRHKDETGPGTGMKLDGNISAYHFVPNTKISDACRLSRFGDGILYLILRHGSPELREPVMDVLRQATAANVVEEMPRTAIWLLREAMPGNHYVAYADRAAREACNTLSPFTLSSLDAAIQKALNLALKEAGLVGRDPNKREEEKAKAAEILGSGAPPWGPYEDEVLSDIVITGLYPLFLSPNITNGEASILRMSAQLLKFANRISVGKRALLQAHIRQFTRDGMAHGTNIGDDNNVQTAMTAAWGMGNIEMLPVESYNYACKLSQQRIRVATHRALGSVAHTGEDGGDSASPACGADVTTGNNNGSVVLALHTLDDLEYGLTYARAMELLPPVTSMRTSFGHGAPLPDKVIRTLAETMFKFVRTLCHVAQKELNWVRLPGGVTYTAVDGLFLPVMPGDKEWNVTDMFRPRNFGFRISFTYTRRSLTLELHAMSLMRSVPMDLEEPEVSRRAAGVSHSGGTVTGTGELSAGGAADAGSGGDAVRARRAGAAEVTHGRAAEFGYWLRNPDVVRMEQIQSMAGRLEQTARSVGGNWRQMPAPPPWWITGWVDRFLRLFLLGALNGDGDKAKRLKLHNIYDNTVLDPWVANSSAAAPWSRLETNVLVALLSLHPMSMRQDEDSDDVRDLGGRLLNEKDRQSLTEILNTKYCSAMAEMGGNSNPDRGCIIFTAQWNKLAQEQKWPLRSTWEILDVVFRLVRMSCCSYTSSWLQSLQVMLEILMNGDVSAELRRETEAKLLSLASDAAFARRLVWATCRGRREEARVLALLSSVVEFQPLLLEAILEHEKECEALENWSQETQFWAVASGPALENMDPEALSLLLQEQYDFDYRPVVRPCQLQRTAFQTTSITRTDSVVRGGGGCSSDGAAAAAGSSSSGGKSGVRMAYCRFRCHEDLQRAVAAPLSVPAARTGSGIKSGGLGANSSSLLVLLPASLWEAWAVASSKMPQRQDSVPLPFFNLVFSRLPRGLQRSDPHAVGKMWGAGLQAVIVRRRPGPVRWYPWGSPPDVAEEAGVVGTLFDAHATEPLPKTWMRELDADDDGVVTYREFLLAYLRHRGGDFLGPQLEPGVEAALQRNASMSAGATSAGATSYGPQEEEGAGAPNSTGLASEPSSSAATAGSRRWQRAGWAVSQGQLSQAFWDRANALQLLRNRDGEAVISARKEALLRAERGLEGPAAGGGGGSFAKKMPVGTGPTGGAGIAAVRQLGARALGALGGGLQGPGTYGGSLPLVALAGLDAVTPEELCEVQRCAWIAYGNLRTAARYLQNTQADGLVGSDGRLGSAEGLTPWQSAEGAALDSVMRGMHQRGALFGQQAEAEAGYGSGMVASYHQPWLGPKGPRSWLQAMSGAVHSEASGGGGSDGNPSEGSRASGRAQFRDSMLLELLVDLSSSNPKALHNEVLSEGDEMPVGPMMGTSPLLMGRTLASVAAQLGADSAEEVATAVGALALDIASEGAGREGLAPPVGGLDEVFCASALRLAAEEVWAFVTDMQALVDQVISPLVAAADQSLPIIERESINTIFGSTNIELILEYEIELLKLLTVQWRMGARTGLVVPSVSGPAQYLLGTAQGRVAASRLRAFGGVFPPSAEQLGMDPLSTGVQLRPILTDPGVAGEVLELLLRLATAYQNYLDRIDASLQELLACVNRDEKGTFTALLKRFGRPVKLKTKLGPNAAVGSKDNGTAVPADGDEEDAADSSDDEDTAKGVGGDATHKQGLDGTSPSAAAASPDSDSTNEASGGADDKDSTKDTANKNGTLAPTKRLTHPPIHHVRPLISIRQLARYGPAGEVEACLRKPSAHLATLAFLATVCRSISGAQAQLAAVQAAVAGGAGATGEAGGLQTATSMGPLAPAAGAASRANVAAAGTGRSFRFRFGFGKTLAGGANKEAAAAPAAVGGGGARRSTVARSVLGPLRRAWQLLLGVNIARVLPLGANLHPLFQSPLPGPSGVLRSTPASTAEHRVALRGVGAAVLAEAGAGAKLGAVASFGERLDVWMEEKLHAGTFTSRVLLVVCTALTCLTWRVVPLLSERRRFLEDLRVANNMLYHRHVVRQLERAINVRPDDDETLDCEVAELHVAIQKAIEEAAKEIQEGDLGNANVEKLSPMNLDSGFWKRKGPKRIHDPQALRAALKLAEERTLHSTFAGARLLSNARRCAARLATANGGTSSGKGAKSGKAASKGGRKEGGASKSQGGEIDSDCSDEPEKVLEAIVAPAPVKKAPSQQPSKKARAAVAAAEDAKGAGVGGVVQLARLFGSRPHEGGGAAQRPKPAWAAALGGGGMMAAVGLMQRAKQFGGALRRAVRRREHARRRWDKTLFLVMQSGALDEATLASEHAREVARLQHAAALLAWKQLRGAAEDILMVFGEVVFRDVGRLFALATAGFLMAFPFAVLGVTIKLDWSQPDPRDPVLKNQRRVMGGLVGGYVVVGFAAMVAAVAQLRRDPSQLKVYRPSDNIRFPNFRKGTVLASWKAHWVNVFALFTLVLEFWQLCAFSYQSRIPYPKPSFLKRIFPWALLDLGPAAYFFQVFALLAFMIMWIAVFFPQTPAGLKRVIMPFLGQAAYLTITSGLLSQLNCRIEDGKLVRNKDITCWKDPRHSYSAVAAMLALGLYVPRATLTPFEVFFPSENLDIKYRGLYVRVVQLLRLGMAGYNLFFTEGYPLYVMLANAGVCALLTILTVIMRPCCIGAINIGRGTGFVLATWSQVVSVAAVWPTHDAARAPPAPKPKIFQDPNNNQWYTSDWRYVYILASGWLAITAVGSLLLVRHLRRTASSAIRFSLKTSPFNYTLPPAAGPTEIVPAATINNNNTATATATATATITATTAAATDNQPPQQQPPPPPSAPEVDGKAPSEIQSLGSSDTATGKNCTAADTDSDASASGLDTHSTIASKAGEEEGPTCERADGTSRQAGNDDDDKNGSDGDKTEAADPALGAALGLPVVSFQLIHDLATQGLLTPADEMRAFMARQVCRAQRILNGLSDSDDDDFRKDRHEEDSD